MSRTRTIISTSGSDLVRAEYDANGNWSVEFLLKGENVRCFAADPHNPNVIYAGTQGNGVLRSEDRGKTWHALGLKGQIVKSIAVSPVVQGLMYAGTKPPAIFVSRDGGQQWEELESFRKRRRWWWFTPAEMPMNQPYVQGLVVSPTDPNVIIAGIELGDVLRSADGGKTWTGHHKGALHDCHSMTWHPTNGNWVYEGGGTGAAYSQNAGATWTQPDPMTIGSVVGSMLRRAKSGGLEEHYGWAANGDPERPDVVYCATAPGPQRAHGGKGDANAYIYRCRGGGKWEKLTGGLPQPLNYFPYALLTDPAATGHLYAGLSNGDVWQTTDYGDHWQQLPLNLGTVWATMILI